MRFDPDALADLEEQRDFLLRSLDDLEAEHEAGEIDDADYASLRDDYTRRTAEVLRALEGEREALAPTGSSRRPWPVVAAVVALVAMAVGAGAAVAASSGSRDPGQTVSGGAPASAPNRLQEAADLAQEDKFAEALEIYDDILAGDPENVEALAERGLLLASLSQGTGRPQLATAGRQSVEAALAVDPDNARSLFYLGLTLRLEGNDAAAGDAFELALSADPPPALRSAIEGFLSSSGAAGSPPPPAAP